MQTLAALRRYVQFMREREGIRDVRLSRAAQQGLALLAATPGKTAATAGGVRPSGGEASPAARQRTRPAPGGVTTGPAPGAATPGKTLVPPVINEPPLEVPGSTKAEQLRHLSEQAAVCVKCAHLAARRNTVVFGVGDPDARIMFVGEAPGEEEDLQGEPFVGRAGQLLTKMIVAMGLTREQVYIANILKCRPDMPPGSPGNRKPTRPEMDTCLPYLRAQIDVIQPAVMIALGATAIEGLLGPVGTIGKLRGNFLEYRGIPLMPTFHPSYLLRNQSNTEKRKVWEDLLQVMARTEMPVSDKQRGYFLSK
jgi:uracil-DNA glycosylase family 4